MALICVQFTLVENVAKNLFTGFTNTVGSVQDPIPVIVKNEDATNTIWIAGQNVSSTTGQSLLPGASIPMALYSNDVPWAFCATGTPIVSVLVGRQ